MNHTLIKMCLGACLLSPAAFAEESNTSVSRSSTSQQSTDGTGTHDNVKIETTKVGKVVVIKTDGTSEVHECQGGEIPKEVLEKLPPEVRAQLQAALQHGQDDIAAKMKEWQAQHGQDDLAAQIKALQGQNGVFGKIKVTIDNNGKRQEFETTFDKNDDISKKAQEALAATGKAQTPEEKKWVADAAKQLQSGGEASTTSSDKLSAKLDKILDRLDRLEGEVKQLKSQTGGK